MGSVCDGVPLAEAVPRVAHGLEAWRPQEHSVYGAVRESLSDVVVRTLTKRTLLGVSWAIEDECIVRAHRPLVIGTATHRRGRSGHVQGERPRPPV